MEPVDDGGGPDELAEMRRVFNKRPRAPSWLLRTWLAAGWAGRWLVPATRRDEGLQQRLELLRVLLRERRQEKA